MSKVIGALNQYLYILYAFIFWCYCKNLSTYHDLPQYAVLVIQVDKLIVDWV